MGNASQVASNVVNQDVVSMYDKLTRIFQSSWATWRSVAHCLAHMRTRKDQCVERRSGFIPTIRPMEPASSGWIPTYKTPLTCPVGQV